MSVTEKFSAIRKGLLEFLILRIVSSDKVYVADMLKRLGTTEFATQEGTLYPLLSKMRREASSTTNGRSPTPDRRASTTSSLRRASRSSPS